MGSWLRAFGSAGKLEAPVKPEMDDSFDRFGIESFPESIDDPNSPVLDWHTAERIFRGF